MDVKSSTLPHPVIKARSGKSVKLFKSLHHKINPAAQDYTLDLHQKVSSSLRNDWRRHKLFRRALGLDLAPACDVSIMLLQRFPKSMPAGAISHEKDIVGAVRIDRCFDAGPARIGDWCWG